MIDQPDRQHQSRQALERQGRVGEDDAAEGESIAHPLGRAAGGAVWSVVGFGTGQALRLGGNLLLTRLLYPEAFGMMALVTVMLAGLRLISDIGIGLNIVQSSRGEEQDYLDTAWTLQVIRGLVLWGMGIVLATPLAHFYGEPELAHVIPVSASVALILGLSSTNYYLLTRRLQIRRQVLLDLVSQAAGLIGVVVAALLVRNHWALVAGGVIGACAKTLLTHTAVPGKRHSFRLGRTEAAEIISFGKWVFVSTLLTFLVGQSDRLVFAKLIPLDLLGIYSIAAMLANLPRAVQSQVVSQAVYPLVSALRAHSSGDMATQYLSIRRCLMALSGAIVACCVALGPTVFDLLYDSRYEPGGWMLQTLVLGVWFAGIEAANGAAFLSLGKPRLVAWSSFAKLIAMLVMIPIGYHAAGFPGAVAGYALSEVPKALISSLFARKLDLGSMRTDLYMTGLLAISGTATYVLDRYMAGLGCLPLARLAAVGAVNLMLWSPLLVREFSVLRDSSVHHGRS